MMNKKNKILFPIIICILLIFFSNNVFAAPAKIDIMGNGGAPITNDNTVKTGTAAETQVPAKIDIMGNGGAPITNDNTVKTGTAAETQVPVGNGFTTSSGSTGGPYTNQEKIPGAAPTSDFVAYLKQIINFGFAIIGILALFMLIIGAYQYLMAAGSGKAEGAKETITSALLGLILGLTAWVILNKINPDLVNMRGISQITGGVGVGGLISGTQGSYSAIKPPANMEAALKQYDGLITQAADKYGVDRNIARAMMWVESSGNANAKSSKDAKGLFQIMPDEWVKLTGTDPSQRTNIPMNIDAGVKYISQIQNGESKGDIIDALGRYNGGPKWQTKSESIKYVPNVIGIANGLKAQGYN